MKHSTGVAGIDTGKAWLDVALAGRPEVLHCTNDAAGHEQLVAWLHSHGVIRTGIEASGGYERRVVRALRAAGFTVERFQPAQVRAYARFERQHAKNDVLDAALIARCTAASAPGPAAPDPRFEEMAEHLTLIEQIEEDIVRAKTRRETFQAPRHRQLLDAEIRRLKAWRAVELKAIAKALCQHADLARRLDLIESVPGVGRRTALALAIRMPELGTLSREQAAALAGLAPFDDDTGGRRGGRHIKGGRVRLRCSLYAAALPAAFRWNPDLVALYNRLIAAGKGHKRALVACARKLLHFVNAVVARGTPWSQNAAAI